MDLSPGESWSDIQAQAPLVSEADGPSKIRIKIPSSFLVVGQASGHQAEHACLLHMLVVRLLPRMEEIQKALEKCQAPPPGKSTHSESCFPAQQLEARVLLPGGKVGTLGTCERSSSSLSCSQLVTQAEDVQPGESNPFSNCCSGPRGIRSGAMLSGK
jgi:hypothetical protein